MAARSKRQQASDADDGVALRHVLVVGGTTAQWDALGSELWAARRNDLAKVVSHAGGMWLTIRPYQGNPDGAAPAMDRLVDVREGCTVIVDPSPDGRARLLGAIDQLRDVDPAAIDETAIAGVLMAPAPVEPDLTVILGSVDHLPPSLVWELAYTEIVYVDATWEDLGTSHVERAIDEFSRRHRRFGGIE